MITSMASGYNLHMAEPRWDGLLSGDPGQAERGIDDWVEGMRSRADRLQALRDQVERIRVTETSVNGAVVVTVDSTGSPVDVRFTDRAASVRPDDLGPLFMNTLNAARARIAGEVRAATESQVGDDLPDTRRMVVDAYRDRFGDAPPPAPRTRRLDDDDFGDDSYLR
ncbi:YbaB/EbfC family nucleoid-associated protein [Saccharothrix sp.]|uniref:YbaB/EbfC family nucleoid-associated protein n=1 Tax=Saccharothrix sp. TaxID=1873460 RepID=UPI0028126B2B|nr:YbaB/EbfC family nucleoid-associated protein [Saccharothrix sp.]